MRDRFGVRLVDCDGARRMAELVEVALRRNPRRAQLLVSTVLGKHVPAAPDAVLGAGAALGDLVRQVLGPAEDVLVVGFAETATGLGQAVADRLRAAHLPSTRRAIRSAVEVRFSEAHSHATVHRLIPEDPTLLDAATVVLVDDELSTGATALDLVRRLEAIRPGRRYVLAALVDARAHGHHADLLAELPGRIDVVALATGGLEAPADLLAQAAPWRDLPDPVGPAGEEGRLERLPSGWPVGLTAGASRGRAASVAPAIDAAVERAAGALAAAAAGPRLHVLGTEELMHTPQRIAARVATLRPDLEVTVSSTTRSPVLVVDEPGYPIRSVIRFDSHDDPADGPGPRFAYNLRGFDTIAVCVDEEGDTAALDAPGGLLPALRAVAPLVLVLPLHGPGPLRGPAFGSYDAADVGWLLKDLSGVALEAPTEEREEAIQSGGAHYAESLPVEYAPDSAYLALFEEALARSSARLAVAVGVVAELVLARRARPVLVSLARAGTPVGVLMRRWAAHAHGLDLPHYAVSIVRGRGIDTVALDWLAAHHDPADVVFVDGWTGKGAIAKELSAALAAVRAGGGPDFSDELAVLADPGACVRIFGTRDDYLIPSSCLNSTVSGLVSRTVLNREVIGPGDFHGAKCYRELAGADRSRAFVDRVAAEFPAVRAQVERGLEDPALGAAPTWAGWASVAALSERYGIGDVNLVKPGVGETTRVLLRRVPWRIVVRDVADPDVGHLLHLAEQRGVPVEVAEDLAYRAVGLIHPRYTRGATGADGLAVGAP